MPELSSGEIDHLAKLSRLTLSAEENKEFARQLPEILAFVDQLNNVTKTKAVDLKPTVVPMAQLRDDEVSGTRLTMDELEKLAPAWRDGQLEVPAVFGEVEDE